MEQFMQKVMNEQMNLEFRISGQFMVTSVQIKTLANQATCFYRMR